MRIVDVIHRKRLGGALSREEIRQFIMDYVRGEVPDYQMSAFTMAVCFQGMTDGEIAHLTLAMADSGERMDLSDIPGIKVDKHSTGGVGDTTTLVLAPLVAAVGVPIAKMSGRGLGHTGGTIDKLESIPGFSTQVPMQQFKEQVRDIGVAVASQTGDLAPADKKLYALRDVTDTVQSIPLIASSIMSKKLASGANAIVLDVKVGDGAFMKSLDDARKLAETMVSIGRLAGRETVAVLTEMEEPLGHAVGNALEVREAVLALHGQGPEDLTELCLVLGSEMVVLGGKADTVEAARHMLQEALDDGRAAAKFKELIGAQGGDARIVDDLSLLPRADFITWFRAPRAGVIERIDAEAFGRAAMHLGAGRARKEDVIDMSVGLVMRRKTGQTVIADEPIVEIHARTEAEAQAAMAELAECIHVGTGDPFSRPLILDVVRAGATATGEAMDVRVGDGQSPDDELLGQAVHARKHAYVPYSRFAVGAALRLSDGRTVTGANVENASYGLTNCAERTAVFEAVMIGVQPEGTASGLRIQEIAVVADSNGPVAPCGACRQVLAEFCHPHTPVTLADMNGSVQRTTVGDLLPGAFGAAQMR